MKLRFGILFVACLSFVICKNYNEEIRLDFNRGDTLGLGLSARNETFQYKNCELNYSYPAHILSLDVTPYPLDFARYMRIDYTIALRKNLVYPSTLKIVFNFGFIRYTKKLDLCSKLESSTDMSCPLDKQLYEGYYKFSLRPYQYIGASLNGIWAKVMAISGKDEEVFMCVKFIVRAKQYH